MQDNAGEDICRIMQDNVLIKIAFECRSNLLARSIRMENAE